MSAAARACTALVLWTPPLPSGYGTAFRDALYMIVEYGDPRGPTRVVDVYESPIDSAYRLRTIGRETDEAATRRAWQAFVKFSDGSYLFGADVLAIIRRWSGMLDVRVVSNIEAEIMRKRGRFTYAQLRDILFSDCLVPYLVACRFALHECRYEVRPPLDDEPTPF